MASYTEETLYELFATLSGGQGMNLSGIFGTILGGGYTQGQASSGGTTVGSVLSTVVKNGLGMMPIVNGLLHLFGGGDAPEPPPLVKYSLPSPLAIQAATYGDRITSEDLDQFGFPRSYGQRSAASEAPPTSGTSSVAAAPQITVNVQAMDARSFLDRSTDIAAAVREAMLHSSSINDVISEM